MSIVTSWTVFFNLKPFTTIYTTVLVDIEHPEERELIKIAKAKIQTELGLDIDDIAKRLGKNDKFGEEWIVVEINDYTATKEELEVLAINKLE